jgi:hypothetical protein
MKPTAAYAAMPDPDLNRHFSRRWTAPVNDRDIPVAPQPKTLDDLLVDLVDRVAPAASGDLMRVMTYRVRPHGPRIQRERRPAGNQAAPPCETTQIKNEKILVASAAAGKRDCSGLTPGQPLARRRSSPKLPVARCWSVIAAAGHTFGMKAPGL